MAGLPRSVSGSLIDRRRFIGTITGGLLASPVTTIAHQSAKVTRIGFLGSSAPPPELQEAVRGSLRERGYIEGRIAHGIRRVAILGKPTSQSSDAQRAEGEAAARALSISPIFVSVRESDRIASALAGAADQGVDGLVVLPDPTFAWIQ